MDSQVPQIWIGQSSGGSVDIGKKRKRDENSPDDVQQDAWLGPERRDWDKTIYRVTRIPKEWTVKPFIQALEASLNLPSSEIWIHSLSFDACDATEPECKACTLSFRRMPAMLGVCADARGYWPIQIISVSSVGQERYTIFFDNHFEGFTPLSPLISEVVQDKIEYGFAL